MSDRLPLLGSLVFKLVISPAGLLTRELSGGHHIWTIPPFLFCSQTYNIHLHSATARVIRRTLRLPGSSWDSLAFQWNKNKHNRIRKWMLWGRSWLARNEGQPRAQGGVLEASQRAEMPRPLQMPGVQSHKSAAGGEKLRRTKNECVKWKSGDKFNHKDLESMGQSPSTKYWR